MDEKSVEKEFQVSHRHRTYFTEDIFGRGNRLLRTILTEITGNRRTRVFVALDRALAQCQPELIEKIQGYFHAAEAEIQFCGSLELPGGEVIKNDLNYLEQVYQAIEKAKLCRHSYIIAIGGGSLLDLVGFAAATAHRGIRLIRVPTTSLSQGDGGVGVKNSVNYFGKKNFIGTFDVPYAVINDFDFLRTLPTAQLRNGFIEAVKVALIRDAGFFDWIESNSEALNKREAQKVAEIIERSARHHIDHIVHGGDPFELNSSRPLDFGHWVAHKLEIMTEFRLSHGEAVAIGIAVDVIYSQLIGRLPENQSARILKLIGCLGFELYVPELLKVSTNGSYFVLEGLDEFREHLGGELSISLLDDIGEPFEAHSMDSEKVVESLESLQARTEGALSS